MISFDFLISDTHFGHRNIIKYCNRPFQDCDNMLEVIVTNYNRLVTHNSKVLFLGDIFFTKFEKASEVTSSLNGTKYLLRGNHDKYFTNSQFHRMGFVDVYDKYYKSSIEGLPVYYSHYPFMGYSQDKKYENRRPPLDGTVIVHGHTHEVTRLTAKKTVHVGVDAWDYGPAPIEEVAKLVKEAYSP